VKDSYLRKAAYEPSLDGLAHFVARKTRTLSAPLRVAGALVFGKNNLVEDVLRLDRSQRTLRPGENPHARDRVSGGSSSGSAHPGAGIVPGLLGRQYGRVNPGACIARWCGRFKPTTDVGRQRRAPSSHLSTRRAHSPEASRLHSGGSGLTGEQTAEPFDGGST